MQIKKIIDMKKDFHYAWPKGGVENYDFIEYQAITEDGEHKVKILFGEREVYGKTRARVMVLIDDKLCAEFVGADDFEKTGEVLSEIRVRHNNQTKMCTYADDPIPERYTMFRVEGLSNRIKGKGVHNAWAVVANVSDHKSLITLASLRRLEKQ